MGNMSVSSLKPVCGRGGNALGNVGGNVKRKLVVEDWLVIRDSELIGS